MLLRREKIYVNEYFEKDLYCMIKFDYIVYKFNVFCVCIKFL